jgi:hypothetical protein
MRKLWRHDCELDWSLCAATAELVADAVGEQGHAGIKKSAPECMNETNGRQKWKRFTSIWRLSISAVYPTLRFRAKVMLGLPPT